MDRVSAFTDLCTAEGLYRYGTQAGGVPPTPITAEWLNLVQEELCNFVAFFLPALRSDDNTQVLKAAQALVRDFAVKATTLAGYGILDAYTKNQTDYLLSAKANNAITLGGYGIGDAYTKTEINELLALRAVVASSLAGYGILDAFTKGEIGQLLSGKQDKNSASLGVTGWKLDASTGLLEQWGTGSAGPDVTTSAIDFPRPFQEVYSCFGNKVSPNATDGDGNSAGAFAVSATQYKLFNDTANFTATIQWRAIGKAPGY
ncbi:phage tail protein [Pseudomonas juntendi]|uniref:gp53-like domain-containing protein n=1 Tax=Pseudomonas juntendi TaxID=2666183 RepID=UPI00244BC6EC|nr:phage tail protein [Pseudomonas juntendi]MDG9808561.1 phage tail protein [Pseudomonas juntendi]